jgi:hypothetical protein
MKNTPAETLELTPAAPAGQLRVMQDPASNAIVELLKSPDALKNVDAMEKLTDLYLKLKASAAEQEFATAFNALQADLPPIQASKPVPNNDGSVRYKFAPYEAIMEQVRPLILKHGFTISFSSDVAEGRIVMHCTLQHIAGHKKTNSFAARVSKPPGASEAQGDGATSTYAKRFALCDALNITIEKDSDGIIPDARALGEPISKDKIQYLKEQVSETGGNEAAFLALAGVDSYDKITTGSYPVLINALELKKRRK